VYVSRKGGEAVVMNGKAYKIDVDNIKRLSVLQSPDTLYISDGVEPVAAGCFTLVITSPKKSRWGEFSKRPGVSILVAPPFSETEIMELWDVGFRKKRACSHKEVVERYRKWGGNARNVLTEGGNETWQSGLDTAITKLSLSALRRSLKGTDALDACADDDNIHRLLNLIPCGALLDSPLTTTDPAFFVFHHAELPTPYVEGKVADSLFSEESEDLHRFLHRATEDPALGGFRGVLYERCIVIPFMSRRGGRAPLERLSPGLSVPQSRLLEGASGLVPLQDAQIVYFSEADELKKHWDTTTDDAVFVPRSKHFPVVDFVLRMGGLPLLVNATVSESHSIKIRNPVFLRLLDAVGLGSPDAEIPFLWVLPRDAYDRFVRPGSLVGASGHVLQSPRSGRDADVAQRLAQYKVLIEIPGAPLDART